MEAGDKWMDTDKVRQTDGLTERMEDEDRQRGKQTDVLYRKSSTAHRQIETDRHTHRLNNYIIYNRINNRYYCY